MATKKIQQSVSDHGKLLNSDMNSTCPFIFKATSKKKHYKLPFFKISIFMYCRQGKLAWFH